MKRYYKRDRSSGMVEVCTDCIGLTDVTVLDQWNYHGRDKNAKKEDGELVGWPDSKVVWHLDCDGGFDIGIPKKA